MTCRAERHDVLTVNLAKEGRGIINTQAVKGGPATRLVYLDHCATTPPDDRVVEEMLRFLRAQFGNASSKHSFGREAREAVEHARTSVARLINARDDEIVFVSGGTEANNFALRGLSTTASAYGRHIITSTIEHPAISNVCDVLERQGWTVTRLPVYADGVVRIEDVRSALKPDTVIISVMLANNEIGTIQPVAEIGALVREERAKGKRTLWLHTDAVQAVGQIEVDVKEIGCDLLSMSGHKLYAPKGTGALFVRSGVQLESIIVGGQQEKSRRGGTESVANIAAFGRAAELAREEMPARGARLRCLRDDFEAVVATRVGDVIFNGNGAARLPHVSNISFRRVQGEGLLIVLDMHGIAASAGSACSAGTHKGSHVLRALGLSDELARASIRFSFGKGNSAEDVEYTLDILSRVVNQLRRDT